MPCTAPEVADRKGYALAGLAGARAAAARLGPDRLRILEPPQANEELGRTLAKLLADPANRPTALLLQHVDGLATVFAAAATAGLGVPQDLCVVPVGSIAEEHGGDGSPGRTAGPGHGRGGHRPPRPRDRPGQPGRGPPSRRHPPDTARAPRRRPARAAPPLTRTADVHR
ncbi:hypothetical protein ACFQZC_03920 [Streptacidiphilus monticola]